MGKGQLSACPGLSMTSCTGIAGRKMLNFVVPTLPTKLKLSISICMTPLSTSDSIPVNFTNPLFSVQRRITQS